MRFGRENAHKKIMHSRLTLIGLLIVAVFMLSSVWERFSIERQTASQTAAVAQKLDALNLQRDQLQRRINYLQNPQGEEEEIRRNFDVAKPGEQVVILTGSSQAASTTATTTTSTQPRPWYHFW